MQAANHLVSLTICRRLSKHGLSRNDPCRTRPLERERPPAPDPFQIGAGNRSRSPVRIDPIFLHRLISDYYRAHACASCKTNNR